ncbi:cathepsin K-like [Engraulis encrasicolus]|uniref:cathepsin K-like n=1 Tax=Engraulis encrasicolus TaxID=184585 RepID=UPI002FD5C7B1
MKLLLWGNVLLLLGSVVVQATHNPALDTAWKDWKSTHQKQYSDLDEESIRRSIWEKNMLMIEAHNQEYELGIHTYELGMNHLGDMIKEEVVERMMGFRPGVHGEHNNTFVPESGPVPCKIDYRRCGYVTSVKKQGNCGACWAFSAVGALEGQLRRIGKELVDLSPQNLLDCVEKSRGCQGGRMEYAFDYVAHSKKGITNETTYPYKEMLGMCRRDVPKAMSCKGFMTIPPGDEDSLAKALAQSGPISVALDASQRTFRFYKKGTYSDYYCRPDKLTHALLVVGYTRREWIVKNSWGQNWGVKGYIYIQRGQNVCGIANAASFPIV